MGTSVAEFPPLHTVSFVGARWPLPPVCGVQVADSDAAINVWALAHPGLEISALGFLFLCGLGASLNGFGSACFQPHRFLFVSPLHACRVCFCGLLPFLSCLLTCVTGEGVHNCVVTRSAVCFLCFMFCFHVFGEGVILVLAFPHHLPSSPLLWMPLVVVFKVQGSA